MMPRRFLAEVVLGASMLVSVPRAQAQTPGTEVAAGIDALSRRDVVEAVRGFRAGTQSTSPAVRSTSEQWLAHVAWAVQGDTKAAAAHLERAFAQARDSSMLFVELARFEGARGNFSAGMRAALGAMRRSIDAERRGIAARTFMDLAVDSIAVTGTRPPPSDARHRELIATVRDTLLDRVGRFHGRTVDARALLYSGIILQDATAIDRGWKSYFALLDEAAAPALDSAGHSIARGVAVLRGGPLTNVAWHDIATGLAQSGLYEHAALFIRIAKPPTATMRTEFADIVAYGDFLRGLRTASNQFYRQSLIGMARPGDLDRAVNENARTLWARLHWPRSRPAFYPAALAPELARRFSTVMSIERDAIPELHLAHAIAGFSIEVEGARPAPVVILDGVAASGLDAWLLDGAGGRAGWVSGDSIFELRTSFTEAPFRAWLALADPQTMPSEALRVSRDSVADVARARRDSIAYLPSVAARVFRAGASEILDSLYDSRVPQSEAQQAFARILFHQLISTSITLHERRHVVDARANRRASPGEAELRAKIDEVTGSRRPKLAMTAILSPTAGADTPHGQANRRIMLGLARWIRKNGAAIAGYDPSMPALLHLPNLTDAQLIAAFTAMRTPG